MFRFFEKKDSLLQEDVMDEIKWDPSVTSAQVLVSVKDGVVSLRGTVPHYLEKSSAVRAAQRVSGVRAVADELEVKLMGSYERSDEDIAQAALNALEWQYSAPKGLQVEIEHGWVTITGEANWDYQRIAAKNAVSQLMGVVGVTNNISLKKREAVQSSDVKENIERALKRFAEEEGEHINVTIEDDKVILSGKVHSLSEVSEAGTAAWNSPGVTSVDNQLRVA